MGQYSTCLLFLIIFNLSQGPDKEEGLRFKQLQDALAEMAESFPDPESFPLFLEHSEQMLQERADVIDVNASASPIRALYEYITQSAPFTKKTLQGQTWRVWCLADYSRSISLSMGADQVQV